MEKKDENAALHLIEMCTKYSEKASRTLREASTQQDLNAMILSVICLLYALITHLKGSELFKRNVFNYIFYLSIPLLGMVSKNEFVVIPVLIASVFQITGLPKFKIERNNLILVFSIFFQPITWLSSSLIEEEHEFWYFMLNTFLVIQILKTLKKKDFTSCIVWFSIGISFRFAETLNQMGDKWSSLPDTADLLLKPQNYLLHITLLCFSIFNIYYFCLKYGKSLYHLEKIILFLVFIYKLSSPDNFILARIIYLLLAVYLALGLDYLNSWILLIALLSKSYNLCLIPLSVYTSRQIFNEDKMKVGVSSTCLHLIMIKSLFFMQGTGNTIASIDVSVGYTALTNYNPMFVGAQLLINTYSSTILMHLLLYKSENTKSFFRLVYTERLYSTIVVFIVSIIFRNHIFIWSVYAPKLCIECCHTLVLIVEFLFYVFISSVSKKLKVMWK
ncbi:GPI ethanolamine phosphate transferase 2 isoform X2 [Coccinella septempunctata]|nr:GPI ethanolamine phosphate transferase 2 isoform X2 [Coccinella septempunctata]